MPYHRIPFIPEARRKALYWGQHFREVEPGSLDLRRSDLAPAKPMTNPEYWPDGTTTHIFPEEDNPTRRNGVQAIADALMARKRR
jgi:hypothetical protein